MKKLTLNRKKLLNASQINFTFKLNCFIFAKLNAGMNYRLLKLTQFSGEAAYIYTIYLTDKGKTLFEIFIEENNILLTSEINDIFIRLRVMGNKTGARISYFTEHEGNPGDGICALYDLPNNKLRLYCIRYGTFIVILGGGGPKLKSISALQEDQKLTEENYLLRKIAEEINQGIKDHEIEYTDDYKDFKINIEFYEEDE